MGLSVHRYVVQKLRAEYDELPNLRLTVEQVSRLCDLEPHVCQAVLEAFVQARYLTVTPEGTYVRSDRAGEQGTWDPGPEPWMTPW